MSDSAPTDTSASNSKPSHDEQSTDTHEASSPVFPTGEIVWAKMKGFSIWPAKVVDEVDASEEVRSAKKKDTTLVRFYGDGNFAWMKSRDLFVFRGVEYVRAKKLKTKGVQAAIAEAIKEDTEAHNGTEFVPDDTTVAEANATATPGRKRPRSSSDSTAKSDVPSAKRRRRSEASITTHSPRRSSRKSASAEDDLDKQLSEVTDKSAKTKASPRKTPRRKSSGNESDYEDKKKRKSSNKDDKKKDKKKKEDPEAKKRVRVSATVDQISQLHKQLLEAKKTSDTLRVLEAIDGFDVSLQALKDTGIGKTIRKLTKHRSKKVTDLAESLYEEWRTVIDIEVAESKTDDDHKDANGSASDDTKHAEPMTLDAAAAPTHSDSTADTQKSSAHHAAEGSADASN